MHAHGEVQIKRVTRFKTWNVPASVNRATGCGEEGSDDDGGAAGAAVGGQLERGRCARLAGARLDDELDPAEDLTARATAVAPPAPARPFPPPPAWLLADTLRAAHPTDVAGIAGRVVGVGRRGANTSAGGWSMCSSDRRWSPAWSSPVRRLFVAWSPGRRLSAYLRKRVRSRAGWGDADGVVDIADVAAVATLAAAGLSQGCKRW